MPPMNEIIESATVITVIEKSGCILDIGFFKHHAAILLIDIDGIHENNMI